MQIDGHHTATFVAARLAGFPFQDAEKIAYAAQYVDDCTNAGIVKFSNSEYLYARIASAHRMVDYNNFVDVENHLAWMPFHFLPGNGGLPKGQSPLGDEAVKLVCRPDSPVARDMLRMAANDRDKPRALHRLGIAMHVYADTFAHQGFVGALSAANQATAVSCGDVAQDLRIKEETRGELWQTVKSNVALVVQVAAGACALMWREHKSPLAFIRGFLKDTPVGHAAVEVYPDLPYLRWHYRDHAGKWVVRDNPAIYMEALDMMVRAMRAWRAGDVQMHLEAHPGLDTVDRLVIRRLFRETTDISGEARQQAWLLAIGRGEFSFGAEVPCYIAKGSKSWKDVALGTERAVDTGYERFIYTPDFLSSDWKLFHDALQIHRSDVVHEILPLYGMCAA